MLSMCELCIVKMLTLICLSKISYTIFLRPTNKNMLKAAPLAPVALPPSWRLMCLKQKMKMIPLSWMIYLFDQPFHVTCNITLNRSCTYQ